MATGEQHVTNGEFAVVKDCETYRVYKNGELLGHFRGDPRSGGYAVFRHGNSQPIARPRSAHGCVLKLTNNEWDGRETTDGADPGE